MNIRNIRSIRAAAALLSMLALSAANPVSAVDATLSDTGNSESNIFDKRGDCYALLEYAINSQVMNSQVNGAESHIYFYGSDGKQTSYHEMQLDHGMHKWPSPGGTCWAKYDSGSRKWSECYFTASDGTKTNGYDFDHGADNHAFSAGEWAHCKVKSPC